MPHSYNSKKKERRLLTVLLKRLFETLRFQMREISWKYHSLHSKLLRERLKMLPLCIHLSTINNLSINKEVVQVLILKFRMESSRRNYLSIICKTIPIVIHRKVFNNFHHHLNRLFWRNGFSSILKFFCKPCFNCTWMQTYTYSIFISPIYLYGRSLNNLI